MSADGEQPEVLVSDRQSTPILTGELIELAIHTLIAEGRPEVELSVSFVEEAEIEDLHVRYMNEPGPTDVLSFPLDPDDVGEGDGRLLGDVVIAPSVAAANRPDDPGAELRLLLVHGILHLLGYDHEEADDRARMWARQTRYSGVSSP